MLSDRIIPSAGRFSNRPLYLQLRDALAERIASGEWKPGSAIPNESDLAREFGVSAGTMRKALDLMEAERLLTRRQGRGTFVNDQTSDELAARFTNLRVPDGSRLCGEVRHVEVTEGRANDAECRRLRLRPDERVYRIHRAPSRQRPELSRRGRVAAGCPVSRPAREEGCGGAHHRARPGVRRPARQGRGAHLARAGLARQWRSCSGSPRPRPSWSSTAW